MNHGAIPDPSYYARLLVDHVPSMLAYWDRDMRCRFANRAFERWFGADPDRLVGTSILDLLGPERFALNEAYIRAALRGEAQTFERIASGPAGVQRHFLAAYIPDIVASEVVGFMVEITDVTALKESEAAMRDEASKRQRAYDLLSRRESDLRQAQRLGQIGSWEWDVGSDIAIWSDELYRLLDCDPSLPPPQSSEHAARFKAQSWRKLSAAVERMLDSGEPHTLELEYVWRDGTTGWIEARGEAVRDVRGRIVRLRGTAQEITMRRQVEEARLQRDVAEAASRNKTLFLSRVSHEFRTPLNAVLGFAQLIQMTPSTGAKQREWAQMLERSGRHMLGLVDDILELSGAELGEIGVERVALDLADVIGQSLSQFTALAEEATVLVFNRIPADQPLPVFADPKRISQVIGNLVSNAIKYTRTGGLITVSAQRRGAHVELRIDDTGIGMSQEQLSRLFIPFERLGAERTGIEGAGLGLALTKKLVELMGGSLRAESRPGTGSSFIVTFTAVLPQS